MRYFSSIFVLCAVCLLAGCSGEDRNLLPEQHKAIQSYLSGKDYTYEQGVYRYVPNALRDDYDTAPIAEPGDSVYYYYEEYVFDAGPQLLVYTNKEYKINADTIINPAYWPLDPVGVKVGATKMIGGLAHGLPYCRQGDSLVLVMITEAAYGRQSVGLVPADSPIIMMLDIRTVKKF